MYRAYVRDNLTYNGVDIVIAQRGGGYVVVQRPDGNLERIEEGTLIEEPTLRLNDEAARALLDELQRHYQGATDLQTVRGDLLHERERVDKMLETISQLATRPQNLHVHKAEQ